jgi:hypothetical protein
MFSPNCVKRQRQVCKGAVDRRWLVVGVPTQQPTGAVSLNTTLLVQSCLSCSAPATCCPAPLPSIPRVSTVGSGWRVWSRRRSQSRTAARTHTAHSTHSASARMSHAASNITGSQWQRRCASHQPSTTHARTHVQAAVGEALVVCRLCGHTSDGALVARLLLELARRQVLHALATLNHARRQLRGAARHTAARHAHTHTASRAAGGLSAPVCVCVCPAAADA